MLWLSVASVVALAAFTACNSEPLAETTQVDVPSKGVEKTAGLSIIPAKELAQFTVKYATSVGVRGEVDTMAVAAARAEAVEELMDKFMPYLREQYDPTLKEFAAFTIAVDKEKGEVSIEEAGVYKPNEMDELELAILGATLSSAEDYIVETRAANVKHRKKEIVRLVCESGKAKGSKMDIDTSEVTLWNATSVGKKVVAFVERCLDGGGCVKVCRASATMQ